MQNNLCKNGGFELDAVAVCYISGVLTSGGIGSAVNSAVGAFVIMSLTFRYFFDIGVVII